jgi:hypothetical protein
VRLLEVYFVCPAPWQKDAPKRVPSQQLPLVFGTCRELKL